MSDIPWWVEFAVVYWATTSGAGVLFIGMACLLRGSLTIRHEHAVEITQKPYIPLRLDVHFNDHTPQ